MHVSSAPLHLNPHSCLSSNYAAFFTCLPSYEEHASYTGHQWPQCVSILPTDICSVFSSIHALLCCLSPVEGMYDYVFSENGLVAYKDGVMFNKMVSHKQLLECSCGPVGIVVYQVTSVDSLSCGPVGIVVYQVTSVDSLSCGPVGIVVYQVTSVDSLSCITKASQKLVRQWLSA